MTAAPQCWKIVWLDLMANSLNSVENYLESHTITVHTGAHVFPGISIQSVKCRGWCSIPDIPWLSLRPFSAAVAQHTVMCTYRSADLNLGLQPAQRIRQICQVDHTSWSCDGLWRRESHWCVCVWVCMPLYPSRCRFGAHFQIVSAALIQCLLFTWDSQPRSGWATSKEEDQLVCQDKSWDVRWRSLRNSAVTVEPCQLSWRL